jgi:hypothetical protein
MDTIETVFGFVTELLRIVAMLAVILVTFAIIGSGLFLALQHLMGR